MPQTFLAVRCCSCSAFQGIQRTQQSKCSCKLCNTKQSITRVFVSGTGKEVRLAVQTLNRARLEAAAVAQEEANAEYEAHYEQEHPGEYAEADGEYAEEAARCAQCGAATDDLDVDVGDGQLYCAACFAAYDAGDAAAYAGDAAPPPRGGAAAGAAAAPSRWAAWAPPAAAAPVEEEEDDDPQFVLRDAEPRPEARARRRASAPAPLGAGAAAPTEAADDDEPPGRAYVEPPPRAPPPLPVVEYGDDDGYGTTLRAGAAEEEVWDG